jgi:hypothetical protein
MLFLGALGRWVVFRHGLLGAATVRSGVTVIATSNRCPEDLYSDGLNRQVYLPPFLELLRRNCKVLHMQKLGETFLCILGLQHFTTKLPSLCHFFFVISFGGHEFALESFQPRNKTDYRALQFEKSPDAGVHTDDADMRVTPFEPFQGKSGKIVEPLKKDDASLFVLRQTQNYVPTSSLKKSDEQVVEIGLD